MIKAKLKSSPSPLTDSSDSLMFGWLLTSGLSNAPVLIWILFMSQNTVLCLMYLYTNPVDLSLYFAS